MPSTGSMHALWKLFTDRFSNMNWQNVSENIIMMITIDNNEKRVELRLVCKVIQLF